MSSTLAAATSRGSGAKVGSASAAQPGRGAARPPRPSLRVVTAPPPDRARTAFVALCLLLLAGGLVTLLLVNTVMAGGSFRLHELQATSDQLADRQQALSQNIAVQAAPARLAARAKALGMIPSGSPAFLRLSDGKVLGVAKAATPTPTPTVSARPATQKSTTSKPSTRGTAEKPDTAKNGTTARTTTRSTTSIAKKPEKSTAKNSTTKSTEKQTSPTER
jgi:hypothetical protein